MTSSPAGALRLSGTSGTAMCCVAAVRESARTAAESGNSFFMARDFSMGNVVVLGLIDDAFVVAQHAAPLQREWKLLVGRRIKGVERSDFAFDFELGTTLQ